MKRIFSLILATAISLLLLCISYWLWGLNVYAIILLFVIPAGWVLYRSYRNAPDADSRNTIVTNALTGLTLLVGILTYQISNDDANDQEKAANLVETTKIYLHTQNRRQAALTETDTLRRKIEAAAYWSDLFDMHWLVFQLYRKSDMDRGVFTTWTTSRFISYWSAAEAIPVGGGETVSCRDEWRKLGQGHYFMDKSEYHRFMNDVYHLYGSEGSRYLARPDSVRKRIGNLLLQYDRRDRLYRMSNWLGLTDEY